MDWLEESIGTEEEQGVVVKKQRLPYFSACRLAPVRPASVGQRS